MLIDGFGYVPGEDLIFGSDGMLDGDAEALWHSLFPPRAAGAGVRLEQDGLSSLRIGEPAMNKDEWLNTEGGQMRVRSRLCNPQQPTILFVHGLGDSGEAFNEAFESAAMQDFNLFVPDLLGYGKSQEAQKCDYSFDAHIARLNKLVEDCERVFVVGHSMGGDLATRMLSASSNKSFCGIINVEGNLTHGDLIISDEAFKAEARNDRDHWFDVSFRQKLVLQRWATEWRLRSCQNYYVALGECRRSAFFANASEMFYDNEPVLGDVESKTGRMFRALELPKMFCWGGGTLETGHSMSKASQALLRADVAGHKFPNRLFNDAFHWVMVDQSEAFYPWLATFVWKYENNDAGFLEVSP